MILSILHHLKISFLLLFFNFYGFPWLLSFRTKSLLLHFAYHFAKFQVCLRLFGLFEFHLENFSHAFLHLVSWRKLLDLVVDVLAFIVQLWLSWNNREVLGVRWDKRLIPWSEAIFTPVSSFVLLSFHSLSLEAWFIHLFKYQSGVVSILPWQTFLPNFSIQISLTRSQCLFYRYQSDLPYHSKSHHQYRY